MFCICVCICTCICVGIFFQQVAQFNGRDSIFKAGLSFHRNLCVFVRYICVCICISFVVAVFVSCVCVYQITFRFLPCQNGASLQRSRQPCLWSSCQTPPDIKTLSSYVKTFRTHCTMVKLKNGVKRSQLWKIISPPIFNENLPNFERWCINIQKII